MLLMVQQDYLLKSQCPQCDKAPEKVMDFLQGLPEEARLAFLSRNQRYFGGKGLPERLSRMVRRGSPDGLEGEFHRLADWWQLGTAFDSYIGIKLGHPAYKQIVALGLPVIPLIFQELQSDPDPDWFFILEEIVCEDGPSIPDELKEKSQPQIDIWLEWGRSRGFIE